MVMIAAHTSIMRVVGALPETLGESALSCLDRRLADSRGSESLRGFAAPPRQDASLDALSKTDIVSLCEGGVQCIEGLST